MSNETETKKEENQEQTTGTVTSNVTIHSENTHKLSDFDKVLKETLQTSLLISVFFSVSPC